MKSYNVIDDTYDVSNDEIQDEVDNEEVNPEFVQDDDTWQIFSDLKIDDSYSLGNVYGTKNIYENFEKSKLTENIYEIFQASSYKETYENKKPSKSEVLDIVMYFLDRIDESESYSYCEKIVAIADLMKIDYLTLFNELPTKLRYSIIKELDEQFNVIQNRSKKLF